MAEQNVEVVKGLYEAFGRGDVPAVLGGMTEDIEWNEAEGMPQGGTYCGPGAVAENIFGPIIGDLPDFALVPEEFIASGDSVAAIVRYTGTGKATGTLGSTRCPRPAYLRDGKVARFRQFADTVKHREVVP